MKRFKAVFSAVLGTGLLIVTASAVVADVNIKTVKLDWEDISQNDGSTMYDSLCAVCHGTGGRGDGTAVRALNTAVPDLTVLAAKNGGVYAHREVEAVISGKHRDVANGAIDMPLWGEQFMYVRPGPGINSFPHKYRARKRIRTLSIYIESLQVN